MHAWTHGRMDARTPERENPRTHEATKPRSHEAALQDMTINSLVQGVIRTAFIRFVPSSMNPDPAVLRTYMQVL